MTRRRKLITIDNHIQAIKKVIKENNLENQIPSIVKIFINRIEEVIHPEKIFEESPFNIH